MKDSNLRLVWGADFGQGQLPVDSPLLPNLIYANIILKLNSLRAEVMKSEINSTNEQPYNVDASLLFGQTIDPLADDAEFILSMDDFRLNEAALFAVSSINGLVFNQYLDELARPNPDVIKIRQLEAELKQIEAEQNYIYSGDRTTKLGVISKYAPRIREAIKAQREPLPNGR